MLQSRLRNVFCKGYIKFPSARSAPYVSRALLTTTVSSGHTDTNVGGGVSMKMLFGAVLGLVSLEHMRQSSKVDNCGIVGVIGSEDASDFLIEGLKILRNRGYDSAGIATVGEDGNLSVTKFASLHSTSDSIELLENHKSQHKGHHIGIGHTRWATHGGKTDANAHPQCDYKDRVAIIHNGTINNYFELKKELQSKGVRFTSETDTEVIANLIGHYLDSGISTKDAVSRALSRCDGSWGIAVVNKLNKDEIIVACNGSPMVIGLGQGKTYIASETAAFSKYTKNFIAMKDGEIGVVNVASSSLDISRVEEAPDVEVLSSPAPFEHFTLKECYEQPEAIARAMSYGARLDGNHIVLGGLDKNEERLQHIENLVLTGCGTSKYASEYGAKIMRLLDCFNTVSVVDSAEVRLADFPRTHCGLLAVSQSGETKDVFRAVKLALSVEIPCLSVVNSVGSLIARKTGCGVYLNAGREHAVASTKAFTTQVTVLALVALWFRQTREKHMHLPESPAKKEFLESLQRLPISFGMALRNRDKCAGIAKELINKRNLFVLGKGFGESIAMEGALKIKEITYLHAEGFSAGALKHGPFALIEDSTGPTGATPVIAIILDDDDANLMRIAAEEVKARGAQLYVITDNPALAKGLDKNPILIPSNGPLTALISILPLQLIAYELACAKGINPDVPRNLAKAVTVD